MRFILLIGGKPFCGTLEPPIVPNVAHSKGAIPLGWYKLMLTKSPHFGRVLPLVNYVSGFEGIRIHAGNTVKDTVGCILVGQLSGTTLFHSRTFEQDLIAKLQKHPEDEHYIEIIVPLVGLRNHYSGPFLYRALQQCSCSCLPVRWSTA